MKGWIFIACFTFMYTASSFAQEKSFDSTYNYFTSFNEAKEHSTKFSKPLLLYYDNPESNQSTYLTENFWSQIEFKKQIQEEYNILYIKLDSVNEIEGINDDSTLNSRSSGAKDVLKQIHKLSNYLQPKGNLLGIIHKEDSLARVMSQFNDSSEFKNFLNLKVPYRLRPIYLDSIIYTSVQYGPLIWRVEQIPIFNNREKIEVQAFFKDGWKLTTQEEPDPYFYLQIEENDHFKFKKKTLFVQVVSQNNNLIVKQQIKRKTKGPFTINGTLSIIIEKENLKYGTIFIPFEIQLSSKKKRHKVKVDSESVYGR